MAGPGARIVDRVGVKVIPDTSKFVANLQKYLKRIEHTLKVEIPTVLDLKGVERDLKAIQAAGRQSKVEIPVEVDSRGVAAEARWAG